MTMESQQRSNKVARLCFAVGVAAIVGSGAVSAQRGGCLDIEPRGWEVRIADEDEPGDRLVLTGQVVTGASREPLSGVKIRFFQTDASGFYSPQGMDERDARLCGVVRTDRDGRYRLETIKPGPYATGGPPPHIHFEVTLTDGATRSFAVNFEGDPELRGRPAGELWDVIRPLERDENGVLHGRRDLWVK